MSNAALTPCRRLLFGLIVAITGGFVWWQGNQQAGSTSGAINELAPTIRAQTDVDRAIHQFDAAGVPTLHITDVGDVAHPAWVALYALQYAGVEQYDETKIVGRDFKKFRACVEHLAATLMPNAAGDLVWNYPFDNTYNDVTIAAPWSSAFGQAVGIEALVASYQLEGRKDHLLLAEKASEALLRPIDRGGLLFKSGNDVWFEEIPVPHKNPTHILNGHMRALLALRSLASVTGKDKYRVGLNKGLSTLKRWLPLYDAGYWFRYDLNPRKQGLWFRLTHPDGHSLVALPIDTITLRDSVSRREVMLDVGGEGDATGLVRIEGADWGAREMLDGHTVRRLRPVKPVTEQDEVREQLVAPFTYFYLSLPADWNDNLRTERYELVVTYKDEVPGHVRVQIRGIAPGMAFRELLNASDLQLIGSRQWRQMELPIRPNELGWWVGQVYADKHALYLAELAREDKALIPWAAVAKSYAHGKGRDSSARNTSARDTAVEQLGTSKSKIVLGADHPDNPLSVMRVPMTEEMYAYAKSILGESERLTPHEKIMRFIDSMKEFQIGDAPADPAKIIKMKVGACGPFTNVVLALAWTQGIQGRYVNLHNYPTGDGHTVAEFLIDGKWRLYDPTYGVYFTNTPKEKHTPDVLSFDDLRSGKGRAPGTVRVLTNWKRYKATRPLSESFAGLAIYERANPAGPIIPERLVVYPLSLDVVSKPVIAHEALGAANQGADYVGSAGVCRGQEWTIFSLQRGQQYEFILEPERIGGDAVTSNAPFTLYGRILSGGELLTPQSVTYHGGIGLVPFRIQFRASSEKVVLGIAPPSCSHAFKYLKVKRYFVGRMSK